MYHIPQHVLVHTHSYLPLFCWSRRVGLLAMSGKYPQLLSQTTFLSVIYHSVLLQGHWCLFKCEEYKTKPQEFSHSILRMRLIKLYNTILYTTIIHFTATAASWHLQATQLWLWNELVVLDKHEHRHENLPPPPPPRKDSRKAGAVGSDYIHDTCCGNSPNQQISRSSKLTVVLCWTLCLVTPNCQRWYKLGFAFFST